MASPPLLSSPTPQSASRLQPPVYQKRHGHKRSSAISGDFDLNNIFINSTPMLGSGSTNNNNKITSPIKSVPLKTPPPTASPQQPVPAINVEVPTSNSSFLYDTPLKSPHTASSLSPPLSSTSNTKLQHPHTRFFMTDEAKFDNYSDVPNALIDLDDILTKPHSFKHKRTESAPAEFTEFFASANFANNNAISMSNSFNTSSNMEKFLASPVRNEIVVEEDEESDTESIASHLLSKARHQKMVQNDTESIGSVLTQSNGDEEMLFLNNNSSSSLQSITNQQPQLPASSSEASPAVSNLRGKAARYQHYYNTQQKVGSVKAISTPHAIKLTPSMINARGSRSSSKSPTRSQFNAGFKFDSISYDIPEKMLSNYYHNTSSVDATSTKDKGNTSSSSSNSINTNEEMLAKPKLQHHQQQTPLRSSSPLKNEITLAIDSSIPKSSKKHLHNRSKSQAQSSPRRVSDESQTHSKKKKSLSLLESSQDINASSGHQHRRSRSLFTSLSKLHLRRNSSSAIAASAREYRKQHSNSSSNSSVISKTTNEDLLRLGVSPRLDTKIYKSLSNDATMEMSSLHDRTITSATAMDLTLTNIGEPGPAIFNPILNDNNTNYELELQDTFNDKENTSSSPAASEATGIKTKTKHRWWFRRKA